MPLLVILALTAHTLDVDRDDRADPDVAPSSWVVAGGAAVGAVAGGAAGAAWLASAGPVDDAPLVVVGAAMLGASLGAAATAVLVGRAADGLLAAALAAVGVPAALYTAWAALAPVAVVGLWPIIAVVALDGGANDGALAHALGVGHALGVAFVAATAVGGAAGGALAGLEAADQLRARDGEE